MRSPNRLFLAVIPLVAILGSFYLLAIGPKRDEAAALDQRVTTLESSIGEAEARVAQGMAVRGRFPSEYRRLVVLGKAVPADSDQASLIYELAELGSRSGTEFVDFEVTESGDSGAASATVAQPPAEPGPPGGAGEGGAVHAQATEATAALLPLGATVGPAGLPVIPYELSFNGSFFELADLFAGIDETVGVKRGRPVIRGRLMTVDGFSLGADPDEGFPRIRANLSVTTYVVPAEQGIAAGATLAGPAPQAEPATTPVANVGDTR